MYGVDASPLPPRLMVGVQSRRDAVAAIAGGAQLLEWRWQASELLQRQGHLESAPWLSEILASTPSVGCCVNLGELQRPDWPSDEKFLPTVARWVRQEFSTCGGGRDWPGRWLVQRQALESAHERSFRWIATAFADAARVDAPAPEAVLAAAIASECSGLCLTTSSQNVGALTDVLAPQRICELARQAREAAIPMFIGGGISLLDIDWLTALEVDVIQVRSAVTRRISRGERICEARVARFCQSLQDAARETAIR